MDYAADAQAHPLYDDYWESTNPPLGEITVPAYVVASWSDQGLHTRGTLLGYQAIASEQKWLEVHGRKKWEYYYQRETLERQKRFFDYFLRGIDNGMDRVPRVRYERRNGFYDGTIRYASDWPLPGIEPGRLYLHGDGLMTPEPADAGSELVYRVGDEQGQLMFTHTFRSDTELTGPARLRLWVEARGSDDMDLYVGLGKLDPTGREVLFSGFNEAENGHVAGGWLRVSHRETDPVRSTELAPFLKHERELKLSPGDVVSVDVEILAASTYFERGESLVLRIQGSELSGAGYIGHEQGVNRGEHVVHIGGDHDSFLVLPFVVP